MAPQTEAHPGVRKGEQMYLDKHKATIILTNGAEVVFTRDPRTGLINSPRPSEQFSQGTIDRLRDVALYQFLHSEAA